MKQRLYEDLLPKVRTFVAAGPDAVAVMANVAAEIHSTFRHWWTGFYRVVGDELWLGPFQGPTACVRIGFGRGVCGSAWKERRTLVVPDVELFPGHIACSSESRSEIVVPVMAADKVLAVLDIDSRELAAFDDVDARYLEEVAAVIAPCLCS